MAETVTLELDYRTADLVAMACGYLAAATDALVGADRHVLAAIGADTEAAVGLHRMRCETVIGKMVRVRNALWKTIPEREDA